MKPNAPIRQAGFGLLETLTGLLVFVLLALIGTKAYHGVVSNQKESAQVKALTDAVTQVAEKLSALSVSSLTGAGSPYLQWSQPAAIGSGEYLFRYHVVPRPVINGSQDTSTVGLEVEIGPATRPGGFQAARLFATLIAPHLASKDRLGQVSTQEERDAEAAFHASNEARIANVDAQAKTDNQARLNSYSCYEPGQCCGFMKDFFGDPTMQPADGLNEKCYYRCAMSGNVGVKTWNKECGTDFCSIAPWKTKEDCCSAIQTGECKSGSVCANVCIDCVGEDGSTCGPPVCLDFKWNDYFDCKTNTFCDGSPLTSGIIPGWGDVQSLCGLKECAGIQSECQNRVPSCCYDYWSKVTLGQTPDPKAEICQSISKASDCCTADMGILDWDHIKCGTDGKAITAHNKIDGKWYCHLTGPGWDAACGYAKNCPATYTPGGAPGGGVCPAWSGTPISGPWQPTYPQPPPPGGFPPPPGGIGGPKISTGSGGGIRVPSIRGGGVFGSFGGRE